MTNALPGALFALLVALTAAALSRPATADAWSETFVGCTKQKVKGAGLSISSYACGPDQGNAHLEADDSVPGFVEVQNGDAGPVREVKIRTFNKAADSPLASILDDVKAASPGPHTASCILERVPAADEQQGERYYLSPTGEAKTAWDKALNDGPAGDPPCGPLGVQFAGDLYFIVLPGDPARVAFIDAGSEIQIFDPSTLRAAN